jgi:signal transduction histidine kinase/DNA-binding response OmpR family regulator
LLLWVSLVFLTFDLRPQTGLVKVGFLTFLVVLVAAFVSQFTNFLLARPLRRLHEGITAVREGRLEPVQVSRTGDEVEYLGESLNAMIRVLGETREEVAQHQDLMEQRIRQRTEALEEATQRALAASRAKSEFLANISHELRTPMNGILGMLEIVLEEEFRPAQREHLETAKSCANTLMALLNDILDLSKIEAGKMLLERIHFDPRLLADDCVRSVMPRSRQKGIGVHIRLTPNVPKKIVGDPLRLRQILTNLLSNAVKFTEQGKVELRMEVEPPAEAGARPMLRLEVADTGVGIPADKLTSIFEEFTQADGSVTRKFGGTGLGLAITRRLVDLHGGTISVTSEVGKGSEFRVLLPLEVAEPADVPTEPAGNCRAASSAGSASRGRVLVAEDNRVNQKVVVALLTRHGYDVILANNGREALDRLKESQFDLILMDIQMPELDGIQTCRLIRRDSRWDRLPVVAMTAHAMNGDRERCIEAGMNGYLSKPVSASHLLEVLSQFSRDSKVPVTLAPAKPYRDSSILPAPIDTELAVRLMDNDAHLMQGMAMLFLQLAPERLQRLQSAAVRMDWPAFRVQAGKLENAAERIAAMEVARCAREAAEASATGDTVQTQDRLALLEGEIRRLEQHLKPAREHQPSF